VCTTISGFGVMMAPGNGSTTPSEPKYAVKQGDISTPQQVVWIAKLSKPAPRRRGCEAPGGGGKLITGRKRHILVDTCGFLLAVLVTSAAVQDRDGARLLLQNLAGFCKKLRLIWVDGGYRGPLIDWVAEKFSFRLRPVLRPEGQKGFVLLARRWLVERTFAWLGYHRRLSKDYERLPQSSEAFIYIAMTRLLLRRLAPN
jgi:putative transposase